MGGLKGKFPLLTNLIYLYPKDYQDKYGDQILQTTADMYEDADSAIKKILVMVKVYLDLPLSIGRQQFIYAGKDFKKIMPNYIKFSGVLSGLLLVPFFLALISNAVNKIIYNRDLYGSWLWSYQILRLWVIILPTIALLLALFCYLYFVATPNKGRLKNWRARALNMRVVWPVILCLAVALGILFVIRFHDSVQCWVQVPKIIFVHNYHRSLSCQSYHFIKL